jgi:polysaccharide export outer membrane protein
MPSLAGRQIIDKAIHVVPFLLFAGMMMSAAFSQEKPQSDLAASGAPATGVPAGYALQAEDEIAVHSVQVKEISDKAYYLDRNGEVNFPLAGVLQLSGHGVREAEEMLTTALKRYYREPDIAISVTSLHVESISVLGAVGTPGVHQLKGPTTLLEALSSAGGVRGDAGRVAIVTRQGAWGAIPHPDAHQIASGEEVVEIDLKSLTESRKPADNILVKPHDVISVPPAEVVYVVGNVKKAGGFALGGKPSLSVLQALALAEGLDPRAAASKARILRAGQANTDQIPVDVKKILEGKAEDVVLRPNDILFIPNNAMKSVTMRTIEAAIQIGTGIAIFHP